MTTETSPPSNSIFAIPSPIRHLFRIFPLATYPADSLPHRAPLPSSRPALYIFADHQDASAGRPSFNPTCLKWQTFLRIAGVEADLVPSNNHASPSGALPFLLVQGANGPAPLTGDKIRLYGKKHGRNQMPSVPEHKIESYKALLAQTIRPAWLQQLYLNPSNTNVLSTLYLPSNPLLATSLRHTLTNAAQTEILRQTRTTVISPAQLLSDALEALGALSTILGEDEWFFSAETPGLFDTEVFAYTHLLLDEEMMRWEENELGVGLRRLKNLVRHRQTLFTRCWEEKS